MADNSHIFLVVFLFILSINVDKRLLFWMHFDIDVKVEFGGFFSW